MKQLKRFGEWSFGWACVFLALAQLSANRTERKQVWQFLGLVLKNILLGLYKLVTVAIFVTALFSVLRGTLVLVGVAVPGPWFPWYISVGAEILCVVRVYVGFRWFR